VSKDSTVRERCMRKREWLNCQSGNNSDHEAWEVCSLRRSLRRHAVHGDHLSEKSAFRSCGRNLAELFKSTAWAFPVKLTPNRPTSGLPVNHSESCF